ncbi:hypothetical protein HELRODRAFT_183224 [Helobdella robusta]|uniref:C-type lectin domain-containing protein n=1 Tax=Helobdella robusta TaxID=6412 RepID=T1FJC2_HELRO|nr:hypothetical protein HELRODRAFT_183224 [Helobdella robusta]ESO11437.1 hypothetical protein HELRODRAFT_183224 [Helobdella robusta]
MNLRGINFRKASGDCSCVLIEKISYKVTNSLTGGCLAFVSHRCPPEFDYVIEGHKCYKYQNQVLSWNNSRKFCNGLFYSHPVIIDSSIENRLNWLYSMAAIARHRFPIKELFWYSGYPKNYTGVDCIHWVSRSAGMYNDKCASTESFLCEIDV